MGSCRPASRAMCAFSSRLLSYSRIFLRAMAVLCHLAPANDRKSTVCRGPACRPPAGVPAAMAAMSAWSAAMMCTGLQDSKLLRTLQEKARDDRPPAADSGWRKHFATESGRRHSAQGCLNDSRLAKKLPTAGTKTPRVVFGCSLDSMQSQLKVQAEIYVDELPSNHPQSGRALMSAG